MPRGWRSKARLHPERIHLISVCACGKEFRGEVLYSKRIFELHQRICPGSKERSGIIQVDPVDSKGNVVKTNAKMQDKLLRAIGPQISQTGELHINTGSEFVRVCT